MTFEIVQVMPDPIASDPDSTESATTAVSIKCQLCQQIFETEDEFLTHITHIRFNWNPDAPIEATLAVAELRLNLRTKLYDIKQENDKVILSYKAEIPIPDGFDSEALVEKLINHPPNQCQKCGRGFAKQSNLKRHISKNCHSKNQRHHKCKMCGRTFNTQGSLKTHFKKYHQKNLKE